MAKKTSKTTKSKSTKAKTPKGIEMKKRLAVQLTGDELSAKGQSAANFAQNLNELEIQFDTVKKDWKAKITDIAAKRDLALTAIREGKEEREVTCTLVKDFDNNRVEYWFRDIVAESREMKAEDRQEDMFAQPAKTGKTKARSFKETREAVADVVDTTLKNMMAPGMKPGLKIVDHTEPAQDEAERKSELADVVREETGRKTKRSSVDRVDRH